MKAFLIARVSTDDQVDALPAQVLRLTDYAKQRGYEYELFEIQESAYKGNREEFRRIIDKVKVEREQTIVVFDKIDRFSRDSSSEEKATLTKLFQQGTIELHFPSDFLFINKNSPATDLFRLDMGVALGGYYSRAIHDNVLRRFEQKLRDGEWIGWAPFGYVNTTLPNGKKWVEIEPLEAKAVKEAYELYAQGHYSLKLIREKLRDSYGFKIGTSQLDLILKNPFYMGQMRVKEKLYPHKYERIVTEKLFEQAKAVREGYSIQKKRWVGLPYPYRGLITCATCGCYITFEKKKGKYIYGHCTQYNGKHGAKYILQKVFTSQLQAVFESIAIPQDEYEKISAIMRAEHEEKRFKRAESLSHIDTEIAKYQQRMERVYVDHIDGLIPDELYEKKFEEFRQTKLTLEKRKSTFELDEDTRYGTISHLLQLSKKCQGPHLPDTQSILPGL